MTSDTEKDRKKEKERKKKRKHHSSKKSSSAVTSHFTQDATFVQGSKRSVQVVNYLPISLGPKPQILICPSCNSAIVTDLKHEPSCKTVSFAVLLCCFFWPFMCIPFCIDSCQDANHYCPDCKAFIGTFEA